MSYSPNSMRDNPGLFLERDELPADQDTQTVILGSLIALGLGVAGVIVIEAGVQVLENLGVASDSAAFGIFLRGGITLVAGVFVAYHFPVIGASLLGAGAVVSTKMMMDTWGSGPRQIEAARP